MSPLPPDLDSSRAKQAEQGLADPSRRRATGCMQLVRPVSFDEALYILCCGEIGHLDTRSVVAGFRQHCYQNLDIYPALRRVFEQNPRLWMFERLMIHISTRPFTSINTDLTRPYITKAGAMLYLGECLLLQATYDVHSWRTIRSYAGLLFDVVAKNCVDVLHADKKAVDDLTSYFERWRLFESAMSDPTLNEAQNDPTWSATTEAAKKTNNKFAARNRIKVVAARWAGLHLKVDNFRSGLQHTVRSLQLLPAWRNRRTEL
jgi:hypothetical protein